LIPYTGGILNSISELMLIHNLPTVEDLLNDDALMEDIGFPEEVVAFCMM
jgi:hypothetical protein